MKHLVICGPPASGKSRRARAAARDVDLIFDFEQIVDAMLQGGATERLGKIPTPAFEVLMSQREAFVDRMREIDPAECRAIVTVVDRHSAERLAGVLDAELVDMGL